MLQHLERNDDISTRSVEPDRQPGCDVNRRRRVDVATDVARPTRFEQRAVRHVRAADVNDDIAGLRAQSRVELAIDLAPQADQGVPLMIPPSRVRARVIGHRRASLARAVAPRHHAPPHRNEPQADFESIGKQPAVPTAAVGRSGQALADAMQFSEQLIPVLRGEVAASTIPPNGTLPTRSSHASLKRSSLDSAT